MSYNGQTNERIIAAPKKLIPIPRICKDESNTVAAACVEAILSYYKCKIDKEAAEWKELTQATEKDGTGFAKIHMFLCRAREADKSKEYLLGIQMNQYMTICDLISAIDRGVPTICLIQAWYEGEDGTVDGNHDYREEEQCGHYVVAVGYDRDCIYFLDPCQSDTYSYIPIKEFDARWHGDDMGERYVRTGLQVKLNIVNCNASYVYKIM